MKSNTGKHGTSLRSKQKRVHTLVSQSRSKLIKTEPNPRKTAGSQNVSYLLFASFQVALYQIYCDGYLD